MAKETAIKLFEARQVRTQWDADAEKWYFSIVDVVGILTETDRPRKYWSDLKSKLQLEGSELSDKIGRLKMPAEDGKMRLTDVADTEQQHEEAAGILPAASFVHHPIAMARKGGEVPSQETTRFVVNLFMSHNA